MPPPSRPVVAETPIEPGADRSRSSHERTPRDTLASSARRESASPNHFQVYSGQVRIGTILQGQRGVALPDLAAGHRRDGIGQADNRDPMASQGFRLYWRWRSRRPGRPKIGTEIRDLIRRMSKANPLWGAPRILVELLKLGIKISQATVGRKAARSCFAFNLFLSKDSLARAPTRNLPRWDPAWREAPPPRPSSAQRGGRPR
jgi:hypothetical protein